jgi:hypothetical protein
MTRKTDIEALLERADKELVKIVEEYNKSLHDKIIDNNLKIDVKNYFNNLRSVLDYLAHDIIEKYCPNANLKDKLYFPITPDQGSFKGTMKKSYPDLDKNHSNVYNILENIQPYKKPENIWLSSFSKINNENKHDKLTPQKKTETKQLNISSGGASMSLGQGASISLGHGASIRMGGLTIPGGQTINTNNPARMFGDGKQEIITWVDFQFEGTGISVITLIKESLNGVKIIFNNLKGYI